MLGLRIDGVAGPTDSTPAKIDEIKAKGGWFASQKRK
jgi:hypothetical protein